MASTSRFLSALTDQPIKDDQREGIALTVVSEDVVLVNEETK